MNFNYSNLIKKSWRIAWKNKLLWIFGLFLTAGIEGFGYKRGFNLEAIQAKGFLLSGMSRPSLLTITIIAVAIALILFIISVICQGSMIKGIDNISLKKKNRFKELWQFGVSKFWRILAIEAIIALAVLILMIPLVLSFLNSFWAAAISAIWILLIIIVITLLGNYFYYVFAYAVIEDKKVKDSFILGWNLYKNNLKVSILVSLLRLGLSIAFAIGLTIAIYIALVPFVLLGLLLAVKWSAIGALIAAILGSIAVFIIALIARGFLNTFHFALSIYTYLQLTGRKVLEEKKVIGNL